MEKPQNIRVRFAPSPTGGLHLGGVRTVLFNYLFAKHYGGAFILRIEDTDRSRFVPGAEDYIFRCLKWCGIVPDESPLNPGTCGPYRQSERKSLYRQYADKLVASGKAYYAFDTPEELAQVREKYPNFQYSRKSRVFMRNSFTLPKEEVTALLQSGASYVIRINMPENTKFSFTDMIRGEVSFDAAQIDDKVLLKADGMPTYHLAVVVDDYLMGITHAFRGEEWLPSTPVHLYLWESLFGLDKMPSWAHLPLILKPGGKGKLSKRDGEKAGFPVFAMDWTDPRTAEKTVGFRERGFLPEAFLNMLALLGWNDGTEQEIFSLSELIEKFTIEKVHKKGAVFSYEKALWFNHAWIQKVPVSTYLEDVALRLQSVLGFSVLEDNRLERVLNLMKDRCFLLEDFVKQTSYFFKTPDDIDYAGLMKDWSSAKAAFFKELVAVYEALESEAWRINRLEDIFKQIAEKENYQDLKFKHLVMPLRLMLVGGKFGPQIFDVAEIIGKEETLKRINSAIEHISKNYQTS